MISIRSTGLTKTTRNRQILRKFTIREELEKRGNEEEGVQEEEKEERSLGTGLCGVCFPSLHSSRFLPSLFFSQHARKIFTFNSPGQTTGGQEKRAEKKKKEAQAEKPVLSRN